MSENTPVERIGKLLKLLKTLPDDIEYLLELSKEDKDIMKQLNDFFVELLQINSKIVRLVASKIAKYYSEI